MLVVTRHAVPEPDGAAFLARSRAALATLAARPGYRGGRVGRSTDDPAIWVIVTEWDGVGAYRRALSAYDVRVGAVPLLSTAHDEPSAFEVLVDDGGQGPTAAGSTRRAADADVVAVGEAAAPVVPTGLEPGEPPAARG